MNKYVKPSMAIYTFDTRDITNVSAVTSGATNGALTHSNIKTVDLSSLRSN